MSTELIESNNDVRENTLFPMTRARLVSCEPKDWLMLRSRGIGGSDVASILGISPWRSNVQLYLEKRGMAKPVSENEPMYWGKAIEPVVRQRYCDLNRCEVVTPTGVLVHPEHEWMLASVDGITSAGRGLEIKLSRTGEGWGPDGSTEIPVAYLCQVHHYLAVTGLNAWDVAVLIGGNDYRQYEILADEEIAASMIDQEAEFWRNVVEGIEPEIRTIDDARAMYPKAIPVITQAEEIHKESITRIRQLDSAIDVLEQERNGLTASLMARMGTADTLAIGDQVLATWKQVKGRTSLDADRLKKELPDVYAKFLKTGEATRRFCLKGKE